MSNIAPEEERIPMRDFPLKPGDFVIKRFSPMVSGQDAPWLGRVRTVYSRNPDPGVTIALHSKEEFDELTGGIHESVRLKYEDTMWAEVVFPIPGENPIIEMLHTYEIVEMLSKNELARIDPEDIWNQYQNIMLHNF